MVRPVDEPEWALSLLAAINEPTLIRRWIRVWNACFRCMAPPSSYRGLIFAARMTCAKRSVSVAMNEAKAAEEPGTAVAPKSVRRAVMLESLRPALTSALSLLTTPSGVPFGAPMPNHEPAS
jgi:hypothetical protein